VAAARSRLYLGRRAEPLPRGSLRRRISDSLVSPLQNVGGEPFRATAMAKRLYVGNLKYTATSEHLQELFEQYGTVTSAQVLSDRETGRSRGFGFVEMANDDEAMAAIESLDGQDHDGRRLTVNEARPRTSGGASGGGGGGGGYRGGGGGGGGYRGGGGYGGGDY
jgi:uncharacterized membrane protein YgcG